MIPSSPHTELSRRLKETASPKKYQPSPECFNCLDFLCGMLAKLISQEKEIKGMISDIQQFKVAHTPDLEP